MKKNIILAGGCFWGAEAIFRKVPGVSDIKSGYYLLDKTTHGFTDKDKVEVVRLSYETDRINFSKILDLFFFTHTPTLVKWDIEECFYPLGRSAIFYMEEEQKEEAINRLKEMEEAKVYPEPIETKVIEGDFEKFVMASEKEQDYYNKNRTDPYCTSIIDNKMIGLKEKFKIG